MKAFEPVTFDYAACRKQLTEFRELLAKNQNLSEKDDILPFFQERAQLCTQFELFHSRIVVVDRFAREFDFFGDFACDLAVGNLARRAYCFVEFEDAKENSVFEKQGKKATREWGRRFDHGYSQIIDWLHKLSGLEVSNEFLARFEAHEITCETVLVVGRNHHLSPAEMQRLTWRSDKVTVNQKKVQCLTFDQLLFLFEDRMAFIDGAVKYGADMALANLAAPLASDTVVPPAKPANQDDGTHPAKE